ncbi:MAG TPA: hypothetical protein VHF27_06825 [Acidimicrobiales bacterium]|nr:hypothetical protein [Acidimicrobiales bacterium]
MSESKRSFWSTIPGLVTGLAGLLTGIVGLVTVLIQLGVLGDDDSNQSVATTETTATTVAGGARSGGGGATPTPTTEVPRFTVSPTTLDFKPADREKKVKVENISETASLTVAQPRVTGQDAAQFSADAGTCRGPLRPGLSCELVVTFSPAGPLRTYRALLQVTADGARGAEVPLTASTLL